MDKWQEVSVLTLDKQDQDVTNVCQNSKHAIKFYIRSKEERTTILVVVD